MTYLGAILYPLSGWILFAFWREVRGRSFEGLLERSLGAAPPRPPGTRPPPPRRHVEAPPEVDARSVVSHGVQRPA
ncbi:MAG: hypothetical protein V3S88_02095 [Alphaproteobacteria bacterium]